jgi:hypothetical protein
VTDITLLKCLFSGLDIACKPNLFGVGLIFIALLRMAIRLCRYSTLGRINTPANTAASAAASA